MKKLIAILMSLCLLTGLSLCVFAAEDEIVSPTDTAVYSVEFISYAGGTAEEVFVETVAVGDTIVITAPPAPEGSKFVGFTVEGEYELVSGSLTPDGEEAAEVSAVSTAAEEGYVLTSARRYPAQASAVSTAAEEGYTIVIRPLGDVTVVANYSPIESEPDTQPTEPAPDDDDGNDSPQTGDSLMVFAIAVIAVLAIGGCALATKKLLSKKN